MRYVFVSDIHGRCDKLIDALIKVNFNEQTDTLVSLGDPFDRGNQSLETLEYIMTCPHHIIVFGNHDLRLRELITNQDVPNYYDYLNGLLDTLVSFCQDAQLLGIPDGISAFLNRANCRNRVNMLFDYFNEGAYALEWSDLIATHAWLPLDYGDCDKKTKICPPCLNPNWRTATAEEFYIASWTNVEQAIRQNLFPKKKMIIGHWHAWRLHVLNNPKLNELTAPYTPYFFKDKLIVIDGCSNAENGCVNTWVYETNEKPTFYQAK